jgi:phosphate transport system substrate-binding protein
VGPKVGVENLSSQQLAEVFSGKVENWQQVGGNDERVRLLIREQEDSSLQIIRQKLESFKNITFSERAKVLFHDYEMVNALNKYSTVIGWLTNSSLKEVTSPVTAIAIDNIDPSQENAYDGKYILAGEYALVYKKENLGRLARKFLDFIFSKKGSQILVRRGLIPIKHQQY